MIRIAVIKGDARMERLAQLLREDGMEAEIFTDPETAAAYGEVVVLPLKGVDPERFNGVLNNGQMLVSGQDFLQREDFSILNAIPTVEGALQVAMEHTPHTIHGSRCCVIGHGRIGRLLAEKLGALGARVCVCARKAEDFAWIRARGYKALHSLQLAGKLNGQDVIFNTVPHMMLPHARLSELKKSCLLIDLASAPGGRGLPFG
jgi:dipicolinic acid synthetase A subunit